MNLGRACAPSERTLLLNLTNFLNLINLANLLKFPNLLKFLNLPKSPPTHLHTLICCQSGADVVHHKRNPLGIVL